MKMPALDALAAPPAGPAVSGAGIEISAAIGLQLGRIADQLQARADYNQRCQQAIRTVPIQPMVATPAGGVLLIAGAGDVAGPMTGYNWAIQRLTVAGLAAADVVSLYRGTGAAGVQPNNLLNNVTGASPTWHPGRTGCILNDGDSVLAAGTGLTTTTPVFLTGEVIVFESWLLPEFLL